jgi:recombination protein RecR
MASKEIEKLISIVARLPGLGQRIAGRLVAHLLRRKHTTLYNLISTLKEVYANTQICEVCNNVDTQSPCCICSNPRRDTGQICVVADLTDLWAIEKTKSYKGHYFVIGGKLSPIDGLSPEDINIDKLTRMINIKNAQEIIIAMNADVDGQTTLFFICEKLKELRNLKITALSQGIPVGGELEYLDDSTISMAITQRHLVDF